MPDDSPIDQDPSGHDPTGNDSTGSDSAANEPWLIDDGGPRPVLRLARWLAMGVYVYVMLIEVILLIGFVALLFGLEPGSWFVDWVYRSVDRTMQPFRGIFAAIGYGTSSTEEVAPTIESSIPFAMIVYGIIALAAHDLVEWLGRPRRT
jgi:hypothetical protein